MGFRPNPITALRALSLAGGVASKPIFDNKIKGFGAKAPIGHGRKPINLSPSPLLLLIHQTGG
jgi:hypothetical protein